MTAVSMGIGMPIEEISFSCIVEKYGFNLVLC